MTPEKPWGEGGFDINPLGACWVLFVTLRGFYTVCFGDSGSTQPL